ncbi:MAG: chromate efflux transporter [Paludibacter sp.]|jgi:chromate transporter|nr:chromate efflux transporter [Paludibacter sp.]
MSKISEIAKLFLKLGIIGFGGPAAHIAMMQDEVVRKRKWMDEQHFLDLIGATNLIPGPNSTEMAIHIGYDRGGWKGLIVAGLCFIVPAVLITGVFAVLYKNYGQLPELQPFVYGITPAIIAIIAAAVYPLAKKSLKSTQLWMIGIAVLALNFIGVSEIIVLFGAGFLAMGLKAIQTKSAGKMSALLPLPLLQITGAGLAASGTMGLFLTFLKVGAILYGSGYVLFAFLDTELVATGLLSRQQLIDAIAVGQFTPGPVFSSVTFIGYQIDNFKGALVATLGIFIPSFVFVALLNPLVKKVRNSKIFAAFLDAVNVASVAVIAVICIEMGLATITDWRTIAITVLSFIVVFGFKKLNSAFIVLGGSLAGYLLTLIPL